MRRRRALVARGQQRSSNSSGSRFCFSVSIVVRLVVPSVVGGVVRLSVVVGRRGLSAGDEEKSSDDWWW